MSIRKVYTKDLCLIENEPSTCLDYVCKTPFPSAWTKKSYEIEVGVLNSSF